MKVIGGKVNNAKLTPSGKSAQFSVVEEIYDAASKTKNSVWYTCFSFDTNLAQLKNQTKVLCFGHINTGEYQGRPSYTMDVFTCSVVEEAPEKQQPAAQPVQAQETFKNAASDVPF